MCAGIFRRKITPSATSVENRPFQRSKYGDPGHRIGQDEPISLASRPPLIGNADHCNVPPALAAFVVITSDQALICDERLFAYRRLGRLVPLDLGAKSRCQTTVSQTRRKKTGVIHGSGESSCREIMRAEVSRYRFAMKRAASARSRASLLMFRAARDARKCVASVFRTQNRTQSIMKKSRNKNSRLPLSCHCVQCNVPMMSSA